LVCVTTRFQKFSPTGRSEYSMNNQKLELGVRLFRQNELFLFFVSFVTSW